MRWWESRPMAKHPTTHELALLADRDNDRLIADVRRELTPGAVIDCPGCGDELTYEPPYDAQPDCNVSAWPGGYCCECGFERLDEKPLDDVDLL